MIAVAVWSVCDLWPSGQCVIAVAVWSVCDLWPSGQCEHCGSQVSV